MSNLLSQKAVLAGLSISGWSARALDRKVTDDTNKRHNATTDAGRFNKLLISAEAMKDINLISGQARSYHYTMTQPWFDEGSRILPTALYAEYAAKVRGFRQDYAKAADAFAKAYPDLKEQRKAALGSMFKEADYPSCDDIRARFEFDLKVMPCPDAADFRTDLAKEHAEDIRADVEARMKEALDIAMKEPVRRIIEVVGKMAERLKAYKPAKPGSGKRTEGIFNDSLVYNIRDLVQLLPAFNLAGDKALDAIIARMKTDLCKEEPGYLRDDAKLRKAVAAKAEAILADAQQFMA